MRIDGQWHLCADGTVRPVLLGEIQGVDGSWLKTRFLVDTGADRTAFSANVLESLELPTVTPADNLAGIGSVAKSVVVTTAVRFSRGGKAHFRGEYAGFTELEALDMCVLGRDVLNLFAVIVDRQGDTVSLLGQQHFYSIAKR